VHAGVVERRAGEEMQKLEGENNVTTKTTPMCTAYQHQMVDKPHIHSQVQGPSGRVGRTIGIETMYRSPTRTGGPAYGVVLQQCKDGRAAVVLGRDTWGLRALEQDAPSGSVIAMYEISGPSAMASTKR